MPNLFNLTEKAHNRLVALRTESNKSTESALRVSVLSGGCSGLSYKLDFDDSIKPEDHIVEQNGFKIVVDKKSLLYITGTELDFSDGLNGKGFQFSNPNATRTCSCGESFAV